MKKHLTFLFLILFSSVSLVAEPGIAIDAKTKTLVAAVGTDYQWYRDGEVLAGKDGKTLGVGESGRYTVSYTDVCGRSRQQTVCVEVTGTKIAKVYLIGDSTMADYTLDADYKAKRYPITGWGQVFQTFMSPDSLFRVRTIVKADSVVVVDKARGGRSTRTFFE
jgi:hypothetical protein